MITRRTPSFCSRDRSKNMADILYRDLAIVAIVIGDVGNGRPMLDAANNAGFEKLFNLLDTNGNQVLDDGDIRAKCNVPGASPRKVQSVYYIWEQIKKACDADGDGVVTPDEFIRGLVIHALTKVGPAIDSQPLGDQLDNLTKHINVALADILRRLWNNLSGNPNNTSFVPDQRTRKQIRDIAMQRTVRGNKQYGMIDL